MSPSPPFPVVVRDLAPAAWLPAEIGGAEGTVAALLPRRYAAYARVAHPAGPGEEPWPGSLDARELGTLCAVLARRTRTPERVWFCLWDGWGWLRPASGGRVLRAEGGPGETPPVPAAPPAGYLAGALDAPRVRLPARDHVLLGGPLDAATAIGDRGDGYFFPQSPNLFWPDDRAWCVATEIDLAATYVGGPAALVDDLLGTPGLDVTRVVPGDPLDG